MNSQRGRERETQEGTERIHRGMQALSSLRVCEYVYMFSASLAKPTQLLYLHIYIYIYARRFFLPIRESCIVL